MKSKTAIVTGSSSGFGLLTAIELALKGFTVIATMREVNKGKPLLDLAKEKQVADFIHVLPLDVTSQDSIRLFQTLLAEYPTIDVLVNNAGFALGGFSEELSVEAYRSQFETNFFGLIAVTQAVLPSMRAKKQGRIINMSSISGRFGFPGLSAYVASKYALEGYSESLRLELKPFGIDVSLIEPGSYQTNIWASVDGMEVNGESPYSAYMENILKEIEGGKYDFLVINFANGDMVGHTGDSAAAIKACEAIDSCLAEILSTASEHQYKMIITADHGNCEKMIDKVGGPCKEHTTNPVPFIYLDFIRKPYRLVPTELSRDVYIQYASGTPVGVLADVAPSILAQLEIKPSKEMDGMDLTTAMG